MLYSGKKAEKGREDWSESDVTSSGLVEIKAEWAAAKG